MIVPHNAVPPPEPLTIECELPFVPEGPGDETGPVIQSGPWKGFRIVRPPCGTMLVDVGSLPTWADLAAVAGIASSVAQAVGATPAGASGRPSPAAEAEPASTAFLAPATTISSSETPEPA